MYLFDWFFQCLIEHEHWATIGQCRSNEARVSVNSSQLCEFSAIANLSATMVTTLPSLSFSLSLSLSLSLTGVLVSISENCRADCRLNEESRFAWPSLFLPISTQRQLYVFMALLQVLPISHFCPICIPIARPHTILCRTGLPAACCIHSILHTWTVRRVGFLQKSFYSQKSRVTRRPDKKKLVKKVKISEENDSWKSCKTRNAGLRGYGTDLDLIIMWSEPDIFNLHAVLI